MELVNNILRIIWFVWNFLFNETSLRHFTKCINSFRFFFDLEMVSWKKQGYSKFYFLWIIIHRNCYFFSKFNSSWRFWMERRLHFNGNSRSCRWINRITVSRRSGKRMLITESWWGMHNWRKQRESIEHDWLAKGGFFWSFIK